MKKCPKCGENSVDTQDTDKWSYSWCTLQCGYSFEIDWEHGTRRGWVGYIDRSTN